MGPSFVYFLIVSSLVSMDINNAGFKVDYLRNQLLKCFMRREMHSTHPLEFEDTHNTFW